MKSLWILKCKISLIHLSDFCSPFSARSATLREKIRIMEPNERAQWKKGNVDSRAESQRPRRNQKPFETREIFNDQNFKYIWLEFYLWVVSAGWAEVK